MLCPGKSCYIKGGTTVYIYIGEMLISAIVVGSQSAHDGVRASRSAEPFHTTPTLQGNGMEMR